MGNFTACHGRLSGVITLMTLLAAFPAHAGDTAALILEADGGIAPAVEAYDQVASDTALELGNGARLKFALMTGCAVVTVEGRGRLTFSATSHDWSGATPDRTEKGACITRVTYQKSEMEPGGINLRAAELPKLAPRPVFILEGFDASSTYDVRIKPIGDNMDEILLGLPQSVAAWPDEMPALEAGRAYELTLIRNGSDSARSNTLLVPANSEGGADEAPIILQFR